MEYDRPEIPAKLKTLFPLGNRAASELRTRDYQKPFVVPEKV